MNKNLHEDQDFRFNIKIIRAVCNLSQQEFADILGITRTTLSFLETGKCLLSKTEYMAIMYFVRTEIDNGNHKLSEMFNQNSVPLF